MKQPHEDQIGDMGQSAVATFFMQVGWGPMPTGKQDLGTDLFVQLRDADRNDMGMMLGVQVKTGDHFFKRRATVEGRPGFWFREGSQKHRSYWADHDVAHVLIIQDEALSRRYWARLDRTTIEGTGRGIRVFIPADQEVTPDVVGQWTELVREAQRRASFEGESWNFQITQVPEDEWARYALLAPRIVAPHLNKGISSDIVWAEAVALCLRSEAHRWEQFAEQRKIVPSIDEAQKSSDIGWRFAAAVHAWTFGDGGALEILDADAMSPSLQIAHSILLSAVLETRGQLNRAVEALVKRMDGTASADQAWLALHHGWQLYENGERERARDEIQRSISMHGSFSSGLINSAIRSTGAISLFHMAPLMTGDLAAAVQASDTPVAWWQTQQIEDALNSYLRNSFEQWLQEEGVIRIGQGDPTHNDLLSAERVAWLLGNRRASRYAAFLRAMANLSLPQGPHAPAEQQLETLRRAGYRKELTKALVKLRRDGPLACLSAFMAGVAPDGVTTTSIRADLEALDSAGSYLPPEGAARWLDFLLNNLEAPDDFSRRLGSWSDPRPDLLSAIAGMYVHFERQDEARLVDFALALDSSSSQLFERPIRRILRSISEPGLLEAAPRITARALELESSNWLGRLLLDAASPNNDAARKEVTRRILSDQMAPTLAGLKIDELTTEEGGAVLRATRSQLDGYRGQRNGIAIGGPDPYLATAMLALHGPESVRLDAWALLMDALREIDAIPERKTAAIEYLAESVDEIPPEQLGRLIELIQELRKGPSVMHAGLAFSTFEPLHPAIDRLMIALQVPAEDLVAVLAELVSRPPSYRRFAIRSMAKQPGLELLLLALTRDSDRETSLAALSGLARRAAEDSDVARFAIPRLLLAIAEGGEDAALRVGGGILDANTRCAEAVEVVEALRSHFSASIRHLAHELD